MPRLNVEIRTPQKLATGNYIAQVVIELLGTGWPGGQLPNHVDISFNTGAPQSIPTNGNVKVTWDSPSMNAGSAYPIRVSVGGMTWGRKIVTPAPPKPELLEEKEARVAEAKLQKAKADHAAAKLGTTASPEEVEAVKQDHLAKAARSKADIAEAEKKIAAAHHTPHKSAGKVEWDIVGTEGNYEIIVYVYDDEHGNPLPGWRGKFINGGKISSFTTGVDGTKTLKVTIPNTEKERYVEVQVGSGKQLQKHTILPAAI
ncbi:MAG: hypothetical protein FJY98_01180 [Candidatus Liptonbacteria bacterium]|nr:hypothetical protein [Candidatus Liptonbacteria bacterium]